MSHARATSPMAQSCTVSARGYDVQAYMHYFYDAPVTVPESWWEPGSSGRRHAARVAWLGVSCGGTPPGSSRRPPCRPAWWPVPRRDRPAVRPAAPCPAFARTRHRHTKPRQNIVYLSAELNRLCRIRVSTTYQYVTSHLLAASFCLYTAWLLIEMLHPGYSRFNSAPA